ncbi:unnamed protein product [Knipowitschia caucasica]|uniref:Uncharacterized protein n=1 Tax=Knipowitschia caucasica TaxID=637954 RepID=A0AAV2LLU5_KNICA
MDYSILKGLIIAFLIRHSTAEDLTSAILSSAVSLHDESQALPQEQESLGAEVVPVVVAPSLQEVQQAVQEASEREGQGAEEVLKGLLERVVEAALGAAESAGEPKVEEPGAVTEEGAVTGEDGATGQVEEVILEDTGAEQNITETLEDGAIIVGDKIETIISDLYEPEKNEEVADTDNNKEETINIQVDLDSATEMVVREELEQEVVTVLSPKLENLEQESVIEKAEELIESAQSIVGDALEQALDTNRLLDNEMHTGAVEGNLVVQEVDSEQIGVQAEEVGEGETVIEAGSIVNKVAEELEKEEDASEEANKSNDHNQEVQQAPDGTFEDVKGGVQEEGLSPEQPPEGPPPSPARSGAEAGAETLGEEILSQIYTEPPVQKHELVLLSNFGGEANELVDDAARNGEKGELGIEAWKIGAICAAVLLVLETTIIIVYILRNRNKNSSSQQRACEENSVEPDAATGGDYNDDTLPAGNGDTQQCTILDASKASTLLQNKIEQEMEQVIPMSELCADERPNSTEPQP